MGSWQFRCEGDVSFSGILCAIQMRETPMKKFLASAFLFVFMVAGAPLHAQSVVENDILNDVQILLPPKDFEAATQLALRNRVERIARIQDVITCIQEAQSMDDFRVCQERENDYTLKIRLAYCNTGVSWLSVSKAPPKERVATNTSDPQQDPECERVLDIIRTREAQRRDQNDGIQGQDIAQ
jgi:hypothetical protein